MTRLAPGRTTSSLFSSTAYGPPWNSVQGTGVTSTGVSLRGNTQKLVVAVDPSVVPYGTKLHFSPNPFGNTQLVFTAADTGGAIVGTRIDFFIASGRAQQLAWGQRDVTGTVIGHGSPTDVAVLGSPGSTQPAPGGTAGNGGTGALLNDTSNFTVGSTSNPNEDFWTAINRLAQERYWYVFSDGETLYLADGPDLMKQTPAASIDRIGNLPRINHLDWVFDNTAWTYASTHKRRRRTQRRSVLAKVTSPVEGHLNLVCEIDEVRAGDILIMSGCGPVDGSWLVSNCRRSVFQVLSEITLVPALHPLSENQVAGVAPQPSHVKPFVPSRPSNQSPFTPPGTVISALISGASTISNANYPYEQDGGRQSAGTPDPGIPGGTHQGGYGTPGYNCMGAIFAVFFNGGIYSGSVLHDPLLHWVRGQLSGAKIPLHVGEGSGNPECTIFESPTHAFIRLNGQIWGTADGLGKGPSPPPKPRLDGGGWIFNGHVGSTVPFPTTRGKDDFWTFHLSPGDLLRQASTL